MYNEVIKFNDEEEYDFLERFCNILRKNPERGVNYSDMAKALETDRHVVKGVVNALIAIGILTFIYKGAKNRIFQISQNPNLRVVIMRIKHLYGLDENLELPQEDWREAIDFLIPLIVTPDQIRTYIQSFSDGGASRFLRTVDDDYYGHNLGNALPEAVREPLVELFWNLHRQRNDHVSPEFWASYIEKKSF